MSPTSLFVTPTRRAALWPLSDRACRNPRPALHVAFDFGSEIFKRPFNAGLTRGRQSIQVKFPSRTRLRAHRKGFQNVGATGDAAVANYIYSVADSIDDLGERIVDGLQGPLLQVDIAILAALTVNVLAMILFMTAGSAAALILARAMQGFATGLAITTLPRQSSIPTRNVRPSSTASRLSPDSRPALWVPALTLVRGRRA